MTIKVLELFAGIGACSKALTNLGIEHEIVDAVEIDKFAIKSFNAVHGTNFEPQDITKWDKDIKCDLIMHGSPCQDFSVAGKGAGGDKDSGTRSSLMYETLRIVEKLKPKYVIWENVKNLLSNKHRHNFDAYLEAMRGLGYQNYYKVLNAKDYGIPQNRERVFTVSILKDIRNETICLNSKGGRNGIEGLQPSRKDRIYDSEGIAATIATSEFYNPSYLVRSEFEWPQPVQLNRRLKDVLDTDVPECFYLSDEQTQRLKESTFNSASEKARVQDINGEARTLCARDYKDPKCVRVGGLYDTKDSKHQAGSVYDPDGISATLSTMQGGNQEPIIIASRGRGKNNEQHLEPRKDGVTNTITSVQKDNYVYDYQIRKLTPRECWRLMGFSDSDFDKAEKVNSNSQLYKQAGNSIVVDVLQAILRNLLCEPLPEKN